MRVTQASTTEVSEYLVGSAAFKAVGTGDPRPAGSIPVHLRHSFFSCPRQRHGGRWLAGPRFAVWWWAIFFTAS